MLKYCGGGYYTPVFLPPQRRRGTIEDGGGGIFYYGGSKPHPTVKRETLFHPSVFRLWRNPSLLIGEAFFGRTHRFAPTELKLISVRWGRGGYYPTDFNGTEFAPHPSKPSVLPPSPQGKAKWNSGFRPFNFALCFLNYKLKESLHRQRRSPSL